MNSSQNPDKKNLASSLKCILIIGAVLTGIVFAAVQQFGAYLPDFMQGFVAYVRGNLFGAIITVAVSMVLGAAAIYLLVKGAGWAIRHVRGMTFREHFAAIFFSAFNTFVMCLTAAYLGYPLMKFVCGLIDFTVVPQSYCVQGALVVAAVLFFQDYRASSYKKLWLRLLLMHAVYAVIAAFAPYLLVIAAIIVVLSLILPGLFKGLEAYAETYQVFYEAYTGSHQAAHEFADAIMHSSIGWVCMMDYLEKKK